jgi:S1-C subfamily serine protease
MSRILHLRSSRILQFAISHVQFLLAALLFILPFQPIFAAVSSSLTVVIDQTQTKAVKLYGAGGFRGLEPYQSGIIISPEGHILTAFSSVLDTDDLSAVLWDGRKFTATLVGADPRLEVAVLKIEGKNLPCYNLAQTTEVPSGTPILAVSNLFGVATGDEPLSVQHGIISVVSGLQARRGVFNTPYHGLVYVLDVETNNPGSAGGALVNRRGELLAMLGKELRNAVNHTWLHYAVPIAELRPSVEAIRSGKFVTGRGSDPQTKPQRSLRLDELGLTLIPEVLDRTPPYVEAVRPNSPADQVSLRPDDLIVLLNDRLIPSCSALRAELEFVDYEEEIRITVQRGQDLMEVKLHGEGAK